MSLANPLQPPLMSRPEFLWRLAPSHNLCRLVQIKFSEVCNKIGVRVPKMWSITTHDELRKLNVSSDVTNGARFLLKCVSYDPKHRTDLFTLPATAAALEAYLKVRHSSSSKVLFGAPWTQGHHCRRHAEHTLCSSEVTPQTGTSARQTTAASTSWRSRCSVFEPAKGLLHL